MLVADERLLVTTTMRVQFFIATLFCVQQTDHVPAVHRNPALCHSVSRCNGVQPRQVMPSCCPEAQPAGVLVMLRLRCASSCRQRTLRRGHQAQQQSCQLPCVTAKSSKMMSYRLRKLAPGRTLGLAHPHAASWLLVCQAHVPCCPI